MQKNISDLDLSNEVDILFAYKNYHKHPAEIGELLKELKLVDYHFGLFCYAIIEQLCLKELGDDNFDDKELEKLFCLSIKSEKNGESAPEANKTAETSAPEGEATETLKKTESNLINLDNALPDKFDSLTDSLFSCEHPTESSPVIYKVNKESSPVNYKVNESSVNYKVNESPVNYKVKDSHPVNYKENENIHMKNLNILLRPLIDLCNKQIVDIVYYVYRLTGINHFNFLFEEFTSETQLVELHLLVAKGMKNRKFDFSDFKEVLESTEEESKSFKVFDAFFGKGTENTIPLPFLDSSSGSPNLSNNDLHLQALYARPFKKIDLSGHLEIAKKIILDASTYKYSSKFFIDNLTNFLSLKFDKQIFEKLLHFSSDETFSTNLNKLPSVPYFFYEDASISAFLKAVSQEIPDPYSFYVSDIKINPLLKVNCYLLKFYLEYFKDQSNSLSFQSSSYLAIAKGFKSFVVAYRSVALAPIFIALMSCDVPNVSDDIKFILLKDISLYLDVFYNDNTVPVVDAIPGWFYGKANQIHEKDKLNTPLIPTLSNTPIETLLTAYHNAASYQEENTKISNYLLYSFSLENNTKITQRVEYINNLILEASNDPTTRIFILKNILSIHNHLSSKKVVIDNGLLNSDNGLLNGVTNSDNGLLNGISQGNTDNGLYKKVGTNSDNGLLNGVTNSDNELLKNRIYENIKTFPDLNWRYRKIFIENATVLHKIGVTTEPIKETFKNDKVFYIRNMIKDL